MILTGYPNAGLRVAVLFWTALSAIIALSNKLIENQNFFATLLTQLLVMMLSCFLIIPYGKLFFGGYRKILYFDFFTIVSCSLVPFYSFHLFQHPRYAFLFGYYASICFLTLIGNWERFCTELRRF